MRCLTIPCDLSELQEHYAEAMFTFNKLSFGAPSHMRPRWLVFAASLLGGGCVYSHFLVGGRLGQSAGLCK